MNNQNQILIEDLKEDIMRAIRDLEELPIHIKEGSMPIEDVVGEAFNAVEDLNTCLEYFEKEQNIY